MQLILYKTQDAQNVIGKTLTDSQALTINLKRDTDITNPVLYLAPVSGVDFFNFNYCSITELSRKYFIADVEMVGALYRLTLRCDVLETYKAGILASDSLYFRQIKTGDYLTVSIAETFNKTISKHVSNKGFDGVKSMIITTLGV